MKAAAQPLTGRRVVVTCIALLLGTFVSMLLAVGSGEQGFDLVELLRAAPNTVGANILETRLPRVVLAAIVGGALAGAGVAFQALLRNPLADPYVLGVSGGAALGGTLAIAAGIAASGAIGAAVLPLSAFAGAALSVLLLYALSRIGQHVSTYTLLLTGVVFNAFASAVITFVKTIVTPSKAQELLFWLMGRLDDPASHQALTLGALGGYVGLGLAVLFFDSGRMNALALGDDGAKSLGIDVERVKRRILFAASLVVGAVVSVSGLIGFVGLIVPHGVRLWLGPDHRLLLPASVFAGAAFLALADLGARLLFPVFWQDAPVGVVTAVIGGPLFLWLLRRRALQGGIL